MRKNISSKTGEAKSIRVLIVEDSEDDVLLMIRQLKKGGYNPVYERVETAAAMLSALQDKTWDIVLTDYKMPRFSGTKAIALLQETNIDLPLIIVSGTIGEDTAVECMRLGAQDFIMKGNMSRLVPAIKREIAEAKSRAERKLAEQAVIASEVRFRELFENMISCVAVYGAVADGTDFVLKDFNRAAEIAEKIDRQKIIGQSLLKVFPGAREMGLLAVLQRVWRTGRSEHVPAAYYKDARNEGWRENYVYKLPTGEVVALYSDITERIKAERKILENEAKYRLLADNVGDVIFVLDMNLNYTYVSPSVKTLRGFKPEEVLQQKFTDVLTPAALDLAMSTLSKELELEKSGRQEVNLSRTLQLEMRRKDGTTVWTEVKFSVIRDENQQPVSILGLTRDITERKRAEDVLRESEKKYRDLYDFLPIPVYEMDFEANITAANRAVFETFRGTEEDLKRGFKGWQLLSPEEIDKSARNIQRLLQGEKLVETEYTFRRLDGSVFPAIVISSIIYSDGKPVGIRGAIVDITYRKQAEEALRETQKQLQDAYHLAEIGSWNWNFSDKTITWSKELCCIVGLKAEPLTFPDTKHPLVYSQESWKLLQETVQDFFKTGKPIQVELEIAHSDSNKRWLNWIGSAIYDDAGKITGLHGSAQNITQRKQMEVLLKQSENRYRSIFENAQEGIYRSTPEGKIIIANQSMANMLGHRTPEELMTSVTDMSRQLYVHPAERVKIEKIIAEQGSVRNYETQFYRKDGSIIWVSLTMHSDRDAKGQIIHYDCISEDITKQKQAVEQIRKALGATVKAITVTVETRDPYTAGHQRIVSDLSRAIATEMKLPADQIEGIRMAAAIHDLGKISVPAEILSKPTKLTNIEFSLIKNHSQSGYDILKDIDFPWPVARIVLEHHERMNGSGYPNGLTGDNILLESRILAVADVVEAMASHRPYRPGLGIDVALNEIEKNKGIFYDSTVVDACLKLFRENGFRLG
ncbi:MAG: hypothetical protein CVU54_07840 [Deltaproteobacteria bacterium HGW-Deltaproteobacteria-12]|jgi:PAS domain S-box-containing protein|nr:MAG: hypothetical protein CVU54_07840 [Deltaproteobacteria bacterium HGW-Deltaproteobacteria-12]